MLKHTQTYEIMTPESVGVSKTSLVLGKLSGRHAFRDKLEAMGYELGANALEDAFKRFKDLADKKKHVFDEDIVALVDDEIVRGQDRIQFVNLARRRRHVRAAERGTRAVGRRRDAAWRRARRRPGGRDFQRDQDRCSRTMPRWCCSRSRGDRGHGRAGRRQRPTCGGRQERHRPRRRHRHDGGGGLGLCECAQQTFGEAAEDGTRSAGRDAGRLEE